MNRPRRGDRALALLVLALLFAALALFARGILETILGTIR
jgi:hypothetical protein